jgi:hypothetical protein
MIYNSVKLSREEMHYWNSFSNTEKSYLLTSDSQIMLDFTEHQSSGYIIKEELLIEELQPVLQLPAVPAWWQNVFLTLLHLKT